MIRVNPTAAASSSTLPPAAPDDPRKGVSPVTTAKAYRLLRAIMNTAVDDGLIKRNPCRIKGAGNEKSPERPVLSVAQVYALADTVGPAYRARILLATFASLRWAELAALRPEDIDLAACTVRISRQLHYPRRASRSGRPSHGRTPYRRLPRPDHPGSAQAP